MEVVFERDKVVIEMPEAEASGISTAMPSSLKHDLCRTANDDLTSGVGEIGEG